RASQRLGRLAGAGGERHGAAAPGFRQPEGHVAVVDVRPPDPEGLAEARAGVHQELAQAEIGLGTIADTREEGVFFGSIEKPDAPHPLPLAAELRQAMQVAHRVRLPQKLAECRNLPVDGRIAVSTLAQLADKLIDQILAENAE